MTSAKGGPKEKCWKIANFFSIFFSIFPLVPPWKLWKKSCRNEFKFWEASWNHKSSSSWKFHNSILKNAKTSQLSASISEKVVPLYETLALYQLFGPLWPWGSNSFNCLTFYVQKVKKIMSIRQKKIFKMEVWSLVWPLKIFLAFFNFLEVHDT